MLIGEISKKTELSRDTIRFYEKKKLIKVDRSKSRFNNYKNYNEDVLKRLILIKKAKSFGFSLNEIAELLEMIDINKGSCNFFSKKVKQKILDIDHKIKELEDMKRLIIKRVEDAKSTCIKVNKDSNCPIIIS